MSNDSLAQAYAVRCWKLLSQRSGHGLEQDDVLQEARLGLVEAANSYDPRRGTLFSTWAVHSIRGYLCNQLKRCGYSPEATQLEMDDEKPTCEALVENQDNDTTIAVRDALARLSPDDRALIEAIHFQERSHAEIAQERGCSTKTIQRAFASALIAFKRQFTQ